MNSFIATLVGRYYTNHNNMITVKMYNKLLEAECSLGDEYRTSKVLSINQSSSNRVVHK